MVTALTISPSLSYGENAEVPSDIENAVQPADEAQEIADIEKQEQDARGETAEGKSDSKEADIPAENGNAARASVRPSDETQGQEADPKKDNPPSSENITQKDLPEAPFNDTAGKISSENLPTEQLNDSTTRPQPAAKTPVKKSYYDVRPVNKNEYNPYPNQ